jgi:uncharacterized C2H2 Zn-finger protein/ribonuclease HI
MAHCSDHLPLIASFTSDELAIQKHSAHRFKYRFWDHDDPHWPLYGQDLDTLAMERSDEFFKCLSSRCPATRSHRLSKANQILVETFHAASKTVPRGSTKQKPRLPPYWNEACRLATDVCDALTTGKAPQSDLAAARRLRTQIINDAKKTYYETSIANLRPEETGSWRFLNSTSRSQRQSTVIQGKKSLRAQSNLFIKFWTPRYSDTRRRLPRLRPVKSLPSKQEIRQAIARLSLRKAAGPDNIHGEHLKHMTPDGTMENMLFALIRETIRWGVLPQAWKHAWIIPLLKPNKNPAEPSSYRPVSLTSIISKVAERVIDTRLRHALRFHPMQHAYQRAHQADDASMTLIDATYRQWNNLHWVDYHIKGVLKPKHHPRCNKAGMAFYDMSDAFSRMPHSHLHTRLRQLKTPAYLTRWVLDFLRHRTAQCLLEGVLSVTRTVRCGAPQGTVLGPLLWLIFINDLCESLNAPDSQFKAVLFADDITVFAGGEDAPEVASQLQRATDLIVTWASTRNMLINATKCTTLFLTPSTHGDTTNPGIQIGTQHVPLLASQNPNAKELGTLFDSRLTFHENSKLRIAAATSQLRKLAFTARYGPSHHHLRTFARALMETRLFYGSAAWGHQISESQLEALNVVQRKMSRAITGVLSAAPGDSALLEANVRPAQVIVPTACASLVERWRRYDLPDPRREMVSQPLPTPDTSRRRTVPFHEHPWQRTFTLIDTALGERQIPLNHFREPMLLHRTIDPPSLRLKIDRVTIYTTAPHTAALCTSLSKYGKDTEEGKQMREAMNAGALARAARAHPEGRPDYELWTDATVIDAEQPSCVSGGVGILFHGDAEVRRHTVACGRLACSYWAEAHTLRTCLAATADYLLSQPPGKLLIATDSQSFLSALAKGPLATETKVEEDTWRELLRLAAAQWNVVLCFVYSHVGTPRNELVDQACEEQIPLISPQSMDMAPIWHTDAVRAVRAHATRKWQESPSYTVPRLTIAGTKRAPLKELTLPRQIGVQFSRIRTGPNTLFGEFRESVILKIAPQPCRFCGMETIPDIDPEPPPPPAEPPPEAPEPEGAFRCDLCMKSYGTQLGLKQHHARQHTQRALRPGYLQCPKCATTCKGEYNLTQHINRNHSAEAEARRVQNRPNLPPLRPAPAETEFQCPTCPIILRSAETLSLHRRTAHPEVDALPPPADRPRCECGYDFPTVNSRRTHRIHCAVWKRLRDAERRAAEQAREQAAVAPAAAPARVTTESVSHFRHCPQIPVRPPDEDDTDWTKWIPFIRQFLPKDSPS